MEKDSLLSSIPRSFHDHIIYQNVYNNWGAGRILLYVVVLLTLITIPLSIKAQFGWNDYMNHTASYILEGFPEITITNGKISCTEDLPYLIAIDSTMTFIVDTSGIYTSESGAPGQILLTNNWISIVKKNGGVEKRELSTVEHFILNETKIKEWGKMISYLIIPGTLLLFALLPIIWHCLRALLFALIGKIIASIHGKVNEFGGLYKVAIMAGTPTLIIRRVTTLVGIKFFGLGFIIFVISCFFIWFAVTSLREKPFIPDIKSR